MAGVSCAVWWGCCWRQRVPAPPTSTPHNAGDHGCVPLPPLLPPWPEEPLGCPELMREERSQPPLLFSITLSSITSPDPANTSPPGALPQLSLEKMVESLKGLRSSYRKTFKMAPPATPSVEQYDQRLDAHCWCPNERGSTKQKREQ